ncbi:MAG: type II toxin-antitoxin system RelE/ParE family toxin [Balneolales bacterium]
MRITFNNKDLKKLAENDRHRQKKLGKVMADKLKVRLDAIRFAETLEELRHVPGKFHELRENRKGQWACSLGAQYRMVFTPHENPIPVDEDGIYKGTEIHGIEIIEIGKDYH